MNASLGVLKEHFFIRELPSDNKPGRPSIVFEVNPALNLKQQKPVRNIRKTTQEGFDTTAETYSQNSQNSEKDPFCEYCEPFSESERDNFPSNFCPDIEGDGTIEGTTENWEDI